MFAPRPFPVPIAADGSKAAQTSERVAYRDIERRRRQCVTEESGKLAPVERDGPLPEITHFSHLPEQRDERLQGQDESPRKRPDRQAWISNGSANCFGHFSRRQLMTGEVKALEIP